MKRFFAVALALLLTTGAFAQKRIEKNGALDSQLSKAIAATIATQGLYWRSDPRAGSL